MLTPQVYIYKSKEPNTRSTITFPRSGELNNTYSAIDTIRSTPVYLRKSVLISVSRFPLTLCPSITNWVGVSRLNIRVKHDLSVYQSCPEHTLSTEPSSFGFRAPVLVENRGKHGLGVQDDIVG